MIKEMIAGYMTEFGPFVSNQIPEIGLDTRMAAAYTTKKKLAASVIWFSVAKNVRKDKTPE